MTIIKSPITPILENPSVKKIQEIIGSPEEPKYIECKPAKGTTKCECFDNVENYIQLHGGKRVLGWTLWELPSLFIEAEFHAVWESPSGELIDITPQDSQSTRILFIRDESKTYNGLRTNNIRLSLSDNPVIKKFLNYFDELFEVCGPEKVKKISMHQEFLYKQLLIGITREMDLVYRHLKKTDPCYCGSGLMLKNCHKKF